MQQTGKKPKIGIDSSGETRSTISIKSNKETNIAYAAIMPLPCSILPILLR